MLFLKPQLMTMVVIAIATAFGYGISPAHATVITNGCGNTNVSCTLDELLGGGSIIIDDKLFDDWLIDDFSTFPVDLGGIDVLALDDQPLNQGLRFNANGEFSVIGFDVIDITLGYRVSTLDGRARIKDNSLELTGFTFGAGNFGGFIDIYEDVFDADGNLIGEKFVTADNFNLPPAVFDLFDSATFPPESQVLTETTIVLSGDDPADTVSLDSFEQRFSQIPEPEILALLVIGLAGLGFSRKK